MMAAAAAAMHSSSTRGRHSSWPIRVMPLRWRALPGIARSADGISSSSASRLNIPNFDARHGSVRRSMHSISDRARRWRATNVMPITLLRHPLPGRGSDDCRGHHVTAERVKTRMAAAVVRVAQPARTSRLRAASVVVLAGPQMSCRPAPVGSVTP